MARVVMVSVVIVVAHQQVAEMDRRRVVMVVALVVGTVRVVLVDPAALGKVKVVVLRAAMALLEHGPVLVARRVVVVIVISVAAHVALVIVVAMTARSVIGWRCREISRSSLSQKTSLPKRSPATSAALATLSACLMPPA